MHDREGLPTDGAQLHCRLLKFQNEMQFDDQKELLCPSDKNTDESKFDITMYTKLIQVMFKEKYNIFISDLRRKRILLYHMKNKDISESNFEKEWNNACFMLKGHGFDENVHDLKNGNLLSVEKQIKILNSLERQLQGSYT